MEERLDGNMVYYGEVIAPRKMRFCLTMTDEVQVEVLEDLDINGLREMSFSANGFLMRLQEMEGKRMRVDGDSFSRPMAFAQHVEDGVWLVGNSQGLNILVTTNDPTNRVMEAALLSLPKGGEIHA